MKSPKELSSEKKLLGLFEEGSTARALAELLVKDTEIQNIQDYGNNVSIKRLGYNDHGPVHMRQVAINAIRMLKKSGHSTTAPAPCFSLRSCMTWACPSAARTTSS